MRKPFTQAILRNFTTGSLVGGRESDKHRAQREAVGNRLEAMMGMKPEWHKSNYCYIAILADEQAAEIKALPAVRTLVEAKKPTGR